MKTLTKVIIGAAVTAASAVVIKIAVDKKKETKYQSVSTPKNSFDGDTKSKTGKDISSKIKKKATRVAFKVLSFAADHKKEAEGVAVVCTVGAGVVKLALSIKDFRQHNKIVEDIQWIKGKIKTSYEDAFQKGLETAYHDVVAKMEDVVKEQAARASDDKVGTCFSIFDKAADTMRSYALKPVSQDRLIMA